MVLNFGKLTSEEEILKEKINKYKKKKKELAALKLPKPENSEAQKNPETSTDEQAKILKKLTAIKQEKAKKDKKYKRTNSAKTPSADPPTPYNKYPQTEQSETPETSTQATSSKTPDVSSKFNLYKNFVASSDNKQDQKPARRGNTIYVEGVGSNVNAINDSFKSFGKILNIKVERTKNHAFITYEKEDFAMEAIKQMHESLWEDVTLKVDLARRQPPIQSFMQPPSVPSDRKVINYDDDMFSAPGGDSY